jgi:hypothetical protein
MNGSMSYIGKISLLDSVVYDSNTPAAPIVIHGIGQQGETNSRPLAIDCFRQKGNSAGIHPIGWI